MGTSILRKFGEIHRLMKAFASISRPGLLKALLILALFLFITGFVLAATDTFNVFWWTVDGGGGKSTGGSYSLKSTIGQPDAGIMIAGDYRLKVGFQPGGPARIVSFQVNIPIVLGN